MRRFAEFLSLRYDANRTRHAYYRQLRLIHEQLECDPALITEAQLRDYFLFVKLKKHWRPKSIRQAAAAARLFFVDLLQRPEWSVFSQIRTKDHDRLPAVLTRQQVIDLIHLIRLRRYRTPIKLIYACGLRLSECLALTIHDIAGTENPRKRLRLTRFLWIWAAKGIAIASCRCPRRFIGNCAPTGLFTAIHS